MARVSGDASDQSEAAREFLCSESSETVQYDLSSFFTSNRQRIAGLIFLSPRPFPVVMTPERCIQRRRQAFALVWEASQEASVWDKQNTYLREHRFHKLDFRPVLSETICSAKATLQGISQGKYQQQCVHFPMPSSWNRNEDKVNSALVSPLTSHHQRDMHLK